MTQTNFDEGICGGRSEAATPSPVVGPRAKRVLFGLAIFAGFLAYIGMLTVLAAYMIGRG